MKEKDLRAAIIAQCRAMNAAGLSQGTAGNISARLDEAMLITPSAIPYDDMRPDMLARMPLGGEYGAWSGRYRPSSEWRFHLDIMRARPDVGAIVHCHSTYATVLSMLHKPIAAAHYMIAIFGGPSVRCTAYAPYGTKELADLAVAGLEGRNGVLLGNHGMIATGATLAEAMWRAGELETLAQDLLPSRARPAGRAGWSFPGRRSDAHRRAVQDLRSGTGERGPDAGGPEESAREEENRRDEDKIRLAKAGAEEEGRRRAAAAEDTPSPLFPFFIPQHSNSHHNKFFLFFFFSFYILSHSQQVTIKIHIFPKDPPLSFTKAFSIQFFSTHLIHL